MINKPTVLYIKFHNQPQPLILTVYDLITAHSSHWIYGGRGAGFKYNTARLKKKKYRQIGNIKTALLTGSVSSKLFIFVFAPLL